MTDQSPSESGHSPCRLQLQAGVKYAVCTCGQSAEYPLCDGTHRGTEFRPFKFIPDQDQSVALCNCRKTHTFPYCDETHCRSPESPSAT